MQAGKQVDNFAAYVAIEGIRDDGWREFSPSEVKRMYTDLGVKDKDTEFHINLPAPQLSLARWGQRRFNCWRRTTAPSSPIRRRRITSLRCYRRTAARSSPIAGASPASLICAASIRATWTETFRASRPATCLNGGQAATIRGTMQPALPADRRAAP